MKFSFAYVLLGTLVSARTLRSSNRSSDNKKAQEESHDAKPSAEACIAYLGGSLNIDQLRWAFSSYSLAQLKATEWDFGANSVPNPDLISETRFWSEYCTPNDQECLEVCPPYQVLIAGPPSTTDAYKKFAEVVFKRTAEGETFRFQGGGIWNPYYTVEKEGFPVDDLVADFTKDNLEALSIMTPELYEKNSLYLNVMPVEGDPFGDSLVMVYPKAMQPKPSAAKECVDYLGGLNAAQLRWAFSSYTLGQLKGAGWDFGSSSVPNPDLISETRFWSELCEPDDETCLAVCPPIQILIAGPPPGTYIYEAFSAFILTGADETFRFQGGGIWSPYYTLPSNVEKGPAWIQKFAEDNTEALSLMFPEDLGDKLEAITITDDPFFALMVPFVVAVPKAVPTLQASSCIEALGGKLTAAQLRWAFSSYPLGQLKANGWDFEGVPNPDLISETRFWSELCGDESCYDACPAVQIKIAGPEEGSDVYDQFSKTIFTGTGETFRQATPGDFSTEVIIDPYFATDDAAALKDYYKAFPETLVLTSPGSTLLHSVPIEWPGMMSPDVDVVIVEKEMGAAESCVEALGGLSVDQLRWSFSSLSLGELKANGWNFEGVPTPDLISETRFWSELCGSPSCKNACPATQVKIAGPAADTATYMKFSGIVMPSGGETYRESAAGDSTDKIIDPYVSGDFLAYSQEFPSAIVTMDYSTYVTNMNKLEAVAIMNSSGDYVTPTDESLTDGTYNPFDNDVVVAYAY